MYNIEVKEEIIPKVLSKKDKIKEKKKRLKKKKQIAKK